MSEKPAEEIRLFGIGGSPGICIGKAYILDKEGVELVQKYSVDKKNIKDEVKRFKTAVKETRDELIAIIENTPDNLKQHAYVFETHLQLLKDKMLYGLTIEIIENESINAEWAFKKSLDSVKALFRDITDPYLKERVSDIVHVGDRILGTLMGKARVNLAGITSRVILVATDLSPAETSQLDLKLVQGLVTDRGGKTSHTSIIARSMEIPAVLGLEKATRTIRNDDLLIVDGLSGIVIINPAEATLREFEKRDRRYEATRFAFIRDSHLPAVTQDQVDVKILGNIEQVDEAKPALYYGADGIGLFRTEFQYLSRSDFPTEEELFTHYREIVEALSPRTVTIRTLDVNGDKAINGDKGNDREENPALGLRAIRYCLKKKHVFMPQLRAILRAAACGEARILFPLISGYDELLAAKQLLREAASELEAEGIPHNPFIPVGAMIEVPSAIFLAEDLAREVDFFSIGTNDLIQYSLAIDRNNKEVSYLYQPLHPSILRMLKHVADVGTRLKIPTCICGEMASDPLYIPVLLGLGFRELSLLPQNIPQVKSLIRSLKISETRDLIEKLWTFASAKDIVAALEAQYGSLLEDLTSEMPDGNDTDIRA